MWCVAASPIVFFVGLGASLQDRYDRGAAASSVEPAIDVVAGYRLHEHVAIGLRASGSQFGDRNAQWGNSVGSIKVLKLHTLDLALAVPVEVERLVVTPWLGRHYASGREQRDDYTGCMRRCQLTETSVYDIDRPPLTAWGVIVGFDAVVDGANRLTLFVDLQSATAETSVSPFESRIEYDYKATTFGIAYRR